jgi:hypothetical protein
VHKPFDLPFVHSFLFALLLSVAGCSSSSATSPPTEGLNLNLPVDTCPEAGSLVPADAGACVSLTQRDFSRDIVPLFDGCAGEVCHDFGDGRVKSQIAIPAVQCCNEIQVIEPGHPERSYLLDKLLGRNLCGGSQMPLGRPAYRAEDIQTISDWICQGAQTAP